MRMHIYLTCSPLISGAIPPSASFLGTATFDRKRRRTGTALCVTLLALAEGNPKRADATITGRGDVRPALVTSIAAWNRGDLAAHVAIDADFAVLLPATEGRGPAPARCTLDRFFLV